jgi:hypothetical protein
MLEDDIIRLEPFDLDDEIELVLDLVMACKFTNLTREMAKEALYAHPTLFWMGIDKRTWDIAGVIYLTQLPQGWSLDAYKDDKGMKAVDNSMDYSYRAGKLVCDYAMTFTDRLFTAHAFSNRGATVVCKKLGFKEDFLLMKKER